VFYAVAWAVCTIVLKLLFGFRAYGRRNVPRSGGVVLAINHQSYLDPVVVGCGVTRQVHYMARDTLFRGLFGRLIRALNAFPVARGQPDAKALREYIERVRSGKAVMLFPEGTRSHDGRLGPLQPGAGMLAVRAGAPVVPTYIDGTFEAWPRHRTLPRVARLSIYFGTPIQVDRREGETRRRCEERILAEIARRLAELEALALSRRMRPRRRVAVGPPARQG